MGRGPWSVLWTSLQMFLMTLQCIPHHILTCHICIYIWLHFFLDGILVFWCHQEVLDGIASYKVDLQSMFTACFLYAFTDSFIIRNHHMWFLDVVTRVLGASAVLVSCYLGWIIDPSICHLVITSTSWYLTTTL